MTGEVLSLTSFYFLPRFLLPSSTDRGEYDTWQSDCFGVLGARAWTLDLFLRPRTSGCTEGVALGDGAVIDNQHFGYSEI